MIVAHLIILTVSLLPASTIAQDCGSGWFGSSCQYKCHCSEDKCDAEGQCTNDAACQTGWFGPSCQYVDLAQGGTVKSNPVRADVRVLIDGNDKTCLRDSSLESVTVTWTTPYPFTWLRLHVNDEVGNHNITVQFSNGTSSPTIGCTNRQNAAISDTALDIHCDLSVTISQVILTGEGIKAICSLYISGGRNVALRQNAAQTSNYDDEWTADRAVNGRRENGKGMAFCTHTAVTDPSPSWTLTLTEKHFINRYVLYNRVSLETRLQGFVLTSFGPDNETVFNYTDTSAVSLVYSVRSVTDTQPVTSVRVNATKIIPGPGVSILTLCEVELYGDSVCTSGKYGRECEKDCNCAVHSEACFVSTGGCPSGCAAGFYGENCQKGCPSTRYGISCRERCSTNCRGQLCHNVTGNCQQCVPGKSGDRCEEDCPKGRYGQDCHETCSEHCAGGAMCNPVNGSCLQGCESGYTSPQCNTKCPNKTYGQDCNMTCSAKCKVNETAAPAVCHHVKGHCLLGCVNDTADDECSALPVNGSHDSEDTALIIGLVVAVVVVSLFAAVLAVIFWRRRRNPIPKEQPNVETPMDKTEPVFSQPKGAASLQKVVHGTGADNGDDPVDDTPVTAEPPVTNATGGYYNTHTVSGGQNMTAIRIEDLGAFLSSHDKDYYKRQFEKVPGVIERFIMEVGLNDENKYKNRYKNICAYDHSRVHLQIYRNRHEGDYINASYVEGYSSEEKYIASQAPNQIMLDDFVRMLWEQKPDKVVMLTNLIEDGKTKCERYWPEHEEISFDGITVELKTTHAFSDFIIRKLVLKKENKPAHHLTQFHFTSWPDGSVPTNPWSLVDFQQRVSRHPTSKPVVVHGSAGSGRTGTFIALCHVLRETEDKGTMDFYSTLVKLRNERPCMIQTLEQYIFLHKAADVAMVCRGNSHATNNANTSGNLQMTSSSGLIQLESEFEAVCKVSSDSYKSADQHKTSSSSETTLVNTETAGNKLKNTAENSLPKNIYRPRLTRTGNESEGYINAVLLPNFTKRNNQILTQLPMPGTISDFWRLVTQYQVSLIVAFEVPTKDDDETIGDYLPANKIKPLSLGPLGIETGPITATNLWEEQQLYIFTNSQYKDSPDLVVTHLKCKSTDIDVNTLLETVAQIREQRSSNDGMILYMCRDGAFYSGLVCVLVLLLDRIDKDHCKTVPLVVGAVKSICPPVIPTLEQYKLLYEVLDRYKPRDIQYLNVGDILPETTSHSVADPTYSDYVCTKGAGAHIYETVDDN